MFSSPLPFPTALSFPVPFTIISFPILVFTCLVAKPQFRDYLQIYVFLDQNRTVINNVLWIHTEFDT
jgi:hypothetical protein